MLPPEVKFPKLVCRLVKPPTFNNPARVSKLGVLDRGALVIPLSDIGVGPLLDTGGTPVIFEIFNP